MKKPMVDTMQREKFDNLYTPECAVYPLLKYLKHWEEFVRLGYVHFKFKPVVWECCDPGNSKITKVLKENGYGVVSTDITTGFDYLKDTPDFAFDIIITNPPYSIKTKIIERCYELRKPFALLLPLTSLEGEQRNVLFSQNGISIIVLDRRIDFTGKGNPWFNASWFCYNIPYQGKLNNWVSFESLERK